jgi:hypothetical protein
MAKSELVVLATLCGLALPAAAYAQDSGFEGGVRAGYGVPLGKVTDNAQDDLSEGISGIIPVWLDAGFRVDPHLFLGAYFQYGLGIVGDGLEDVCDIDQVDCTTKSIRVGAQIHYHIAPDSQANPWIGYGLGYEWYSFNADTPAGDIGFTTSGFEFANFQAGLDFKAAPNFYIGPFLSFSLGQYSDVDASCSGALCQGLTVEDGSIDEKTLHEWFVFGIRGGYTAFGG